MSDEKSIATEVQESHDEAEGRVRVCGQVLTKHPFTNAELKQWARIYDERGVETANKRIITLQSDARNLSNKRVDLQRKAVEKLEEKLDAEYERDEWDADKIARLTEQILVQQEKLEALQEEDKGTIATRSLEIAQEIDDAQAIVQEAHLEMAWVAAGRPGPGFEEWRRTASLEDYQAARQYVQAGNTPFNRRQRRAHSGKGTS